ncbi:hypothetical protein JYU22_04990 [Gammaproteobacteria bacterium AH-315-E17]|nr:hypothetical protein [Gammaproteobacteria bacterium AH-315-E17]
MTKSFGQHDTENISKWESPCLMDMAAEGDEEPKRKEEIKQQAHDVGYDQGYLEGLEKGTQEMEQKVYMLDKYLTALARPFNEQNQHLAEYLAHLSGKIAKSIVRRELRTEPEIIMALVRDAVSSLNSGVRKVNIHLNPENARLIRNIINVDSQEQSWNIIDDPMVSHSDCKVSCEDSLVDADLQTRINLIITQFLGDERNENRQ